MCVPRPASAQPHLFLTMQACRVPGQTRGKRDKAQNQTFCRNKKNVTGLCNRSSCPLANSRYATIVEDQGACFLYIKTIERAHTPNRMWEKIQLSANYSHALSAIDEHLEHFPKFQIHKCKQRLTKITQYLIRMRKLKLKVRSKLVGIHKKVERREARREAKAAGAAKLEKSIEKELLERLKQGTYGGIYNFPLQEYEKALDKEEIEEVDELEEELEAEKEPQYVEDDTIDDFDDMEDFQGAGSFSDEDDEGSSSSDSEDDAGGEDKNGGEDGGPTGRSDADSGKPEPAIRHAKRKPRRGKIEMEYEEEREMSRAANVDLA
jgi:protein MAK16